MTRAIDWKAVQAERESGVRVADLAKKYGVSDVTIYSRTSSKPKPIAKTKPGARLPSRAVAANGQQPVHETIKALRARRERIEMLILDLEAFERGEL